MEELKEDYSGLSREEQLGLAEEWYEKAKFLTEQEFEHEDAIKYAQKASFLLEKWEKWDVYLDTRNLLLTLWLITHKNSIIENTLTYTDETIQLCRQKLSPSHPTIITALLTASQVYFETGAFFEGLHHGLEALQFVHKFHSSDSTLLTDSHQVVSMGYQYLREYPKGIEYGKKAVKHALEALRKGDLEYKDVVSPHTFLGAGYYKYGDNENALTNTQKALEFVLKATKISAHDIAPIYANLSVFYGSSGDVKQKILYARKSFDLLLQEVGEEHYITATRQQDLGNTLIGNNQLEEGFYHLKKSIKILKRVLPKNHFEIGRGYAVLANSYLFIGNYTECLSYARKALKIYEYTYDEYHLRVISTHKIIAIALSNLGKHSQALKKIEQLIPQGEKVFGKTDSRVASLYQSFAELNLKAGNTTKACQIMLYIETMFVVSQEQNRQKNTSLFNAYHQIFPIIRFKGDAFLEHYLQKTQAVQDLQKAIEAYLYAVQLLDKMKITYHSEASKLVWSAAQSNLFEKGIFTALKMNDLTSNFEPAAFHFSEKNKASLLLTATQTTFAQTSANIPLKLQEEQKRLKLKLTYLEKSIQQLETQKKKDSLKERETNSLQKFQEEYFEIHQQYVSFLQQLEADYPNYYQLKYDTKTVTPSELQSTLEENQTLISYFIGGKSIYIFVLTSNEFEIEELEKPDDFEEMIQAFLKFIHAHEKADYLQLAYQLYELLIAPVELHWYDGMSDFLEEETSEGFRDFPKISGQAGTSSPQQLIVIPHAELSYLPFEALISEQENENTPYSKLNYLVQKYEVSYHYSATLWHYAQQRKGERIEMEHSFAGFAPVYQFENESLETKEVLTASANDLQAWTTRSEALRSDGIWPPLPYSKEEVENIAALFEEKGFYAATYLYEEATKERFQESVGMARYLLVAAHGVVNDEKTALSGLVFYPNRVNGGRQTVDGNRVLNDEHRTLNDLSRNLGNEFPITNHQSDCILSMEETYPLTINADLVVLSSCESGIGKLHKGEGMMAVNRGFLTAGAKNVISTLFKVYDKPSSLLTQYLFEAILEGDSYRTALRKAKLKLMEMEGVSPKSWCGFVLIGA